MRILHVTPGHLFGGVEILLLTLARSCAEQGDEVHVAVCSGGRFRAELTRLRTPVHDLPVARLRSPRSVMRARQALSELLRREAYDAVVCHHAWSLVVFGPTTRSMGVPLVCWVHAALQSRGWIDRWAVRVRPELVICASRYIEESVSRAFPRTRTAVCHLPVPAWRFTETRPQPGTLREAQGTPPETTVILQVSRMEEGKGHVHLLEALGGMRDLPGWEAWLVGGAQRAEEREYELALQRRAHALGISDRVRFLGDRDDVPALLQEADVFCHPNVVPEGFGLACLEALYAGVPTIAMATGGTAELVDDRSAVLLRRSAASELEPALRRLVTDRELRAELGMRGRRRVVEMAEPRRAVAAIRRALSSVIPRRQVVIPFRRPRSPAAQPVLDSSARE